MTETTQHARPQWKNPDWLREMRETNPVWQDPANGMWHVFGYRDAVEVLTDHQRYSSDPGDVLPSQAMFEGMIIMMDPPRHHRLRSLVSRAFTPKAIAKLSDRIAEVTTDLLDQTSGDRLELIADLAYPLPVIVIAELLGVPAEDRTLFKGWADALLSQEEVEPTDQVAMDKAMADMDKFREYLLGHVAQRRLHPRADLLGDLVVAEIDGEKLDDGEIAGFATILLIAGHVTTTALLGNSILCLDEHPDAQDLLRANPDKLPVAIEEVMRYRTPFAQVSRFTATDVELGGKPIPAKSMLNVWMSSANRDRDGFEAPDEFRVDRSPNPHLAFGKGIHFCIGAPLARLEGKVALEILLRRYRDIRIDRDQPVELHADPGINGVTALHLLVESA